MDAPDGPPPLPDTQDPFALLGVEPAEQGDERALRRAYARLIKVYRPDRAAEQFARIHAAFEAAQRIRQLRARDAGAPPITAAPVPVEPVAPAPPAPSAPAPAPLDHGPALRAFIDAAFTDDAAAFDAALARGLDDGVPLDVLLGRLDERAHVRALRSPALTWSRLARHTEHDVLAVVLLAIVETRLAAGDHDGVAALLGDERLFDDAAARLHLASSVLRAIAALGWRSDAALPLLARFRSLPRHPQLDRWIDRVEVELAAGIRLRAPGVPALPPALLAYLRDEPLASPKASERLAILLARALDDQPATYLRAMDALVAAAPVACDALADRLRLDVPDECERLDRLPAPVFRSLSRQLQLATRARPSGLAWVPRIAAVLGFSAIRLGGAAGVTIVVAALVVAAAAFALRETRGYRDHWRGVVARILIDVAVPHALVCRWLHINGKLARDLSNFAPALVKDRAMSLLGLVAVQVCARRAGWKQAIEEAQAAAAPA